MITNPQPAFPKGPVPPLSAFCGMAVFLLLALPGCAVWTQATASAQWIAYPVKPTNVVDRALPALYGRDRQLQAKEARLMATIDPDVNDPAGGFMADDQNPAADVVRLLTVGTVCCKGPADIEREVTYDPRTGLIVMRVKTSNSDWLGSLFGGMWNAASGIMSFIAQVAGGAGNKL